MDKIEKIQAKIVRMLDDICEADCFVQKKDEPRYDALTEVLDFVDTLEEESNESLVEEVKQYYSDNFAYISSDQPTLSILTNVARHFAEWQKEQMLKDAVEGEAEELYNDGESQCTVGVGTYFKPGERVYVLKAMEDEE